MAMSPYPGSGATSTSGSGYIPASDGRGAADAARETQAEMGTGPSRGSALHPWGACKPCAFVFQEGCANGADCDFCHLCEPGERKRRKKERRKLAASWKGGRHA